ncbi:glycosyltransferase family 2 protein, partial [Bacteroides fragilis]
YLPFVTDTSLVYMYIICLLPKWIARFFLSLLNYIVKK